MFKSMKILAVVLLVGLFSLEAYAAQTKSATRTRDSYAPFEELLQITPANTVYDPPLRGCIVEVAGDISLNMVKGDASANSSDVVITVLAGQLIPALIEQVLAAGTTATVVCGR